MAVITAQVLQEIETTGAGSTPDNCVSVYVINAGNAEGQFNGARLPAGVAKNLPVTGKPYSPISYNATGTTFLITLFK
jgi:hypothetical protein